MMIRARRAERIVVIDGCPLNCARHTLMNAGFNEFTHIELQKFGYKKGNCPVTEERIADAAEKTRQVIEAEVHSSEPISS